MRQRRVIIFDDERIVLLVLRDFFQARGYEVLTFAEPVVCPIYQDYKPCASKAPCGDLMLTDFRMPRMSGIDLLRIQTDGGCKLTPKNKAVLSGYMDQQSIRDVLELGAAFFTKPVSFEELGAWVDECESRMDLSVPLGLPRKEHRRDDSREIVFSLSDSAPCRGATVNLSPSGLCVRISAPIERQSTVMIQTPLPITSPVTHVRWLVDAGNGAYLAGLQCVPRH